MKVKAKLAKYILFIGIILFGFKAMAFWNGSEDRELSLKEKEKTIILNDNGMEFKVKTKENSVEEFLSSNQIRISKNDEVIPGKPAVILPGSRIEIKRAVEIQIEADGKTIKSHTLQKNVLGVIAENGLALGKLDKISPDQNSSPQDGMRIVVTRINEEEKVIPEEIAFKTVEKKDTKMGWREKKVEQKGEKGVREVKYKITYKNGREISRVALEKTISKEPIPEIIIQGTYVKIGKSHRGLGTWYAFQGGLYAASPWLPMGSHAKVTNRANGKSVIVEINDRGPFGENRIIDLDKPAFQKIADLGAGVIDVKVEEILN